LGAGTILISFLFGTFLQISSVEDINRGLFDLLTESISVGFLLVLLVLTILGRTVSLERLLPVVVLIIATALLISPLFWDYQPFSSSVVIKCGFVAFQATLWVDLARWSYQYPRLKTIVFGAATALMMASTLTGQMFSDTVRDMFGINFEVITGISLGAIWVMVILSMFLFGYLLRGKRGGAAARTTGEGPGLGHLDLPIISGLSLSENHRESIEHLSQNAKLSPRELEVLTLFIHGRSAKYISQLLVISEFTVKTHLHNIYQKVGVHTRQELLTLLEREKSEDSEKR
jgi:DNA-binding CsgD family transcriptional regulator